MLSSFCRNRYYTHDI
nr:unnamed protein product [Callosobruchus chinensis]